jgi:hypothetical protein
MPRKRAPKKTKSRDVIGQARRPAKMLRAGMYARVSTNDQQTLATQNRAMREYAARRGWTIALQLREVNSGVARREARQKLIEAARRREINVVLVWRLDRWGRSVTATLEPWALGRVKFPSKPSIPFRVFSVVRLSATPNMVLESGQCLDNDSKLFLNARRSQFTSLDLDIQARTRHLPFHRFLHHGSQPVFAGRHIQIESGIDSRR